MLDHKVDMRRNVKNDLNPIENENCEKKVLFEWKKKSSKNTVIVVTNFIINSENVLDVTKLFQRFCDKLKC